MGAERKSLIKSQPQVVQVLSSSMPQQQENTWESATNSSLEVALKPAKPQFRGLSQELTTPRLQNFIQPKLVIGQPDDRYEREADQVASDVVKQINSPHLTQSSELPFETNLNITPLNLQTKSSTSDSPPSSINKKSVDKHPLDSLESSIQQLKGSGRSLDPHLQNKMEQAMGADFSGVKIHTNSQANQINNSIQAKAFTTGQDIFFRQGDYDPDSRYGQELLAHELTHVMQQNGSELQHQGMQIQCKLTPDQIKHINRIRAARNLPLVYDENANATDYQEELSSDTEEVLNNNDINEVSNQIDEINNEVEEVNEVISDNNQISQHEQNPQSNVADEVVSENNQVNPIIKTKKKKKKKPVNLPKFPKEFPSTSIGSEVELTTIHGITCVLRPNADRDIGFVRNKSTNESLVMITKDQLICQYGNPKEHAHIPMPSNQTEAKPLWNTHALELVVYPTEINNQQSLKERNDAVKFVIDTLNLWIKNKNHEPLESMVSEDERFEILITQPNHLITSGLGNSLQLDENDPEKAGFTKSAIQATIGYSIEDIGKGTLQELEILDSAPWYKANYKDEVGVLFESEFPDKKRKTNSDPKSPEQIAIENVYALSKSIVDKFAQQLISYSYPMGSFKPVESSKLGADGFASPDVKNSWKIMPRTNLRTILNSFPENIKKPVLKYLEQSQSPVENADAWKAALNYLVKEGGQLGGHYIDDAKVGGQSAMLFEYRKDLPNNLSDLLPKPTQKEIHNTLIQNPLDGLTTSTRSKVVKKINKFISDNKNEFEDWCENNQKNKYSISVKVEWMMTQKSDEWKKIMAEASQNIQKIDSQIISQANIPQKNLLAPLPKS